MKAWEEGLERSRQAVRKVNELAEQLARVDAEITEAQARGAPVDGLERDRVILFAALKAATELGLEG